MSNLQKLKTRFDRTHIKVTQQLESLEPDVFLSQPGDLFHVLVQIRGELKDNFAQGDSILSELESQSLDSAGDKDYISLQKGVWQSLRTRFRQANLKLTKELESKYYESQRHSLFGQSTVSPSFDAKSKISTTASNLINRGKSVNVNNAVSYSADEAVKSAERVTSDLQRMTQLLTTAVERSGETVRTLDDSSRLLHRTNRQYQTMGDLMVTSRALLSRLWQRDFIDRYFIGFAFCVYLLVVLYIISKRIWIPSFFVWIWNALTGFLWSFASLIYGTGVSSSNGEIIPLDQQLINKTEL